MSKCNNTLEEQGDELVSKEDPLWHNFTFHHFGVFLTAAFGLVAVLIAVWLIIQHARHYSKPWEQKHIIRILLMIPIYAIVSFLSYYFYRYAIYWEVIRDCYEAFAIASFFTLLCHYLEPTLHDQKNYFRQCQPKNWVWPLNWCQKCTGGRDRGLFRIPRSGLTWFNIIWVGVFQYCAIRVICTFISLITQFFDRYCENSLSPVFSHIWVMVFESIAVAIAMYCLIQFYVQLKQDLAQHKPFVKILCIKLVIFFSFWQSLVISFLSSADGPLKPTKKIAYPDIKIGIPSLLLCIEMAIFAILHIWAFSYRPYDISSPLNAGNSRMQYRGFFSALLDAFNPWDIVKALARSLRWLVVGYRKRETDESYNMKPTGTDGADDFASYSGPTFAGTGEPAMEYGTTKPRPSGGSDTKEDTAGLLSHAQSNPHTGPYLGDHPAYRNRYGNESDLGLTATHHPIYDEYSAYKPPSYPPSMTAGREPSPYRYETPPPMPGAHAHSSSGAGSSPVVVSPLAAQNPFAGATRPGYAADDDYEHVSTSYQRPAQGQGQGRWDPWGGAGAPPR